jgi:hypothetical protein
VADKTWRVIAQRILTGQFLDWDIPLAGAMTIRELSGPGGISGKIAPALRHVLADDGRPLLEEWSTALFIEEGSLIRGGGIVQSLSADGGQLTVDAPGFSSYPNGVPITKNYLPGDFEDPTTAFKNLWAHLQSMTDSNLGMTVNNPPTYMKLSSGSGPFQAKSFEYKDYGVDLNNIATSTPFDYIERHAWNAAHTGIDHSISIGFPRLGTRRLDLRFAQGENITFFSPVAADGARFSNEVHLLGGGEGSTMPAEVNAVRDGRLRRPVVVAKKAATPGLAVTYAAQERRARQLELDITQVQIREHPNAPIAAIQPGDDVYTEVEVEWYGPVRLWLRVLSIEESESNPGLATLKTQRSDFFVYASATNPSPDGQPVIITV